MEDPLPHTPAPHSPETAAEQPEGRGDARKRWGLIGAVVGAIAASLCCLGPLVLITLGIGGAWAGSLSALEPYRPFFMAFTVLALGYAFYRVYRKPKDGEHCATGSCCATPRSDRISKVSLWVVTVVAVALMASPWLLGLGTGKGGRAEAHTGLAASQTRTVTLALRGMTCNGCVLTVTKALKQTPGVVSAVVTLRPPRAEVTYDPSRTDVPALQAATRRAGYPASPVP